LISFGAKGCIGGLIQLKANGCCGGDFFADGDCVAGGGGQMAFQVLQSLGECGQAGSLDDDCLRRVKDPGSTCKLAGVGIRDTWGVCPWEKAIRQGRAIKIVRSNFFMMFGNLLV